MKRTLTTCIAIAAVLTVGGCSQSEPEEVAPAACMRAIDAQQVGLMAAAEGMGAASRGSGAGLDAAAEKIDAIDSEAMWADIATCAAATEAVAQRN